MRRTPAALAIVAAVSLSAAADDLFFVSLVDTGDPNNTLMVGAGSLPDLVSDLADREGDFSSFANTAFNASLRYAGVEGAVQVSFDPTGGSGGGNLITITSLLGNTGTFVFDEANGNLGTQLEDFFLKDNPDTISNFLSALARESVLAVTDGNPLAATALSARYKFNRFGLHADWTPTVWELGPGGSVASESVGDAEDAETAAPQTTLRTEYKAKGLRTRIEATGSLIDAGAYSGQGIMVAPSTEWALTERVSIVTGLPMSYHVIEDADTFNVGLHVDVPIRLLMPEAGATRGLLWQVTPGGSVDANGSYDFAAGGVLYSLAVNNRLTYLLDNWSFTFAQQLSYHKSTTLTYDDYEFDADVDQQILKLGGKVNYWVKDSMYVFGGLTYTDFLDDAAVDNYWTPTAGAGFRLGTAGRLNVAYEADLADGIDRHGARVEFQFPF